MHARNGVFTTASAEFVLIHGQFLLLPSWSNVLTKFISGSAKYIFDWMSISEIDFKSFAPCSQSNLHIADIANDWIVKCETNGISLELYT